MESLPFENRMASTLRDAERSDDATRLRVLEKVAQELEEQLEAALEMARPDDVGAPHPS
ncbi:MAG: hypothetical protein H0T12_00770 [Actinobacteria bacterium]|nr:hypothetical protein [Actinomycetota bacterium]